MKSRILPLTPYIACLETRYTDLQESAAAKPVKTNQSSLQFLIKLLSKIRNQQISASLVYRSKSVQRISTLLTLQLKTHAAAAEIFMKNFCQTNSVSSSEFSSLSILNSWIQSCDFQLYSKLYNCQVLQSTLAIVKTWTKYTIKTHSSYSLISSFTSLKPSL